MELGIADPACSVIKPLQNPHDVDDIATMQVDTQQLHDPSFVLPPLYKNVLDFIDTELYRPMPSPKRRRTSRSSSARRSSRSSRSSPARHASPASHTSHLSGGAKRKHRMRRYSRKRRTRRRKYTRRRAS
jgi:hypothetical protein